MKLPHRQAVLTFSSSSPNTGLHVAQVLRTWSLSLWDSYSHGLWWIKTCTSLYSWNLTPSWYSANIGWKYFSYITCFEFSVRENQWAHQHRFHPEYELNPRSWLGCSMPGLTEWALFRSGIIFNFTCPSLFPASVFCLIQFLQFLLRGSYI